MQKIALIIPTRGDRPEFLRICKNLIHRQTVQPDEIIFIDHPGRKGIKDITGRYRKGVQEAAARGCSIAFFWEDDDWYHPQYIEWMLKNWKAAGMPNLFGIHETYYYHVGVGKRLYMKHAGRASAFCTMVKIPFKMRVWPADHEPFLDMHIWKSVEGTAVGFDNREKPYAIGIKHGMGLSGGGGHSKTFNKWERGEFFNWFKSAIGNDYDLYYKEIENKCK
jgi:hypothetical protein